MSFIIKESRSKREKRKKIDKIRFLIDFNFSLPNVVNYEARRIYFTFEINIKTKSESERDAREGAEKQHHMSQHMFSLEWSQQSIFFLLHST